MVDNFSFKDIPDVGEFISLPAFFFSLFYLLACYFLAISQVMRDLSSPTGIQTHAPFSRSLNYLMTMKVRAEF